MRQQRKLDHIKYALSIDSAESSGGFEDICLVNNSLPGLGLQDIDTTSTFLGKRLKAPLLINAMTGGHPGVKEINRSLAILARDFGIAMAVGSQRAGLEDHGMWETYTVVRKENPGGVILANVSASATPCEAAKAVEMISADGLQLYLNVPHELAMQEGERNFRDVLDNIGHVVLSSKVPVIVKEVGFGLSRESAASLYEKGVRMVDLGGKGGTNFVRIENLRSGKESHKALIEWGIPTVTSLLEVVSLDLDIFPIATGGIRSGVDVIKSLTLGAGLVGIAYPFLKALLQGSDRALHNMAKGIIDDLRLTMLLTGAESLNCLIHKPVVITGATAQWLERRGIDINRYARR